MFSSCTEEVKVERYNDCEVSICQACLSSDRVLSSLGDCEDVYQNICLNSYSIQSELYFCWECTAMLKKIKLFKEKLRQAQRVLHYQYFNQQNRPKTCLSKLTTTKINTENIIIFYEEQDTDNKYNIKIKQEVDFENESVDHNYSEEIKLEDDLTDTLQNVTFDCDLNKKKERAKKYRMILKTTEGRASRKIKIGIEELDMWLTREKNSIFYRNLDNKCDKCVTKLSRKQSLDEHNKSHHDETVGRYTCDICQTHFATKSSMASHVAGHYYARHCNICGYECYTSCHMNNHMEGHKKTVQCLDCHACYNNVRQFYKHYKEMHCDYICDHCGKRCKSKHSLEKHMRDIKNMNDKNYESDSSKSYKKNLQKQLFEQQELLRATGVTSGPESDINTSQRKKKSKRIRYVNGNEKILHEDSNDDSDLALRAKQDQVSFTAPLPIKPKRKKYKTDNDANLDSTNNNSDSSSIEKPKKSRKKKDKRDKRLEESNRDNNFDLGELTNEVLEIERCEENEDNTQEVKIENTLRAEETVAETPHTAPKHQDLTKSNENDNKGNDNTEIIEIDDKFSAEQTAVETRQKVPKHKDIFKSNDNYVAMHAKQEQASLTVPSKHKRKKLKRDSNAHLDHTNNESESSCTIKSKKTAKRNRDSDLNIKVNTNSSDLANDYVTNECCEDSDDSTVVIKIDDYFSAEETVVGNRHEVSKYKNMTKIKTKQEQASFTAPSSIKLKSDPNRSNSTNNKSESSSTKESKKLKKKQKKIDNDLDKSFRESKLNLGELKKDFLDIEGCKDGDDSIEVIKIEIDTPNTGRKHQDTTKSTIIDNEGSDRTEIITIEDNVNAGQTAVETRHKVSKHEDLIKSNTKQEQISFATPATIKHKKHKSHSDTNSNTKNNESESTSIEKIKKSRQEKKRDRDHGESLNASNIKLGLLTNEFMEIGWCREDDSTEKITIEDTFSAEETVLESPLKAPKHKELTKSNRTDSEGSDIIEIVTIEDKFNIEQEAVESRNKVPKHEDLAKSNDSSIAFQAKPDQSSFTIPFKHKHNLKKHKSDPNANLDSTNDEYESLNIKKSEKSRKKKKKIDNDLGELNKEFLEIDWYKNNDDSTEIIKIEDTLSAEETIVDTSHTGPQHQDLTESTIIDSEDSDSTEIITMENKFGAEQNAVESRQKVTKYKDLTNANAKKEQTSFAASSTTKYKKHEANLNFTNNESESSSIKKIKKSRQKKKRDRDLDKSFNDGNIKLGQLKNEFMEIGWCREDDSTEKITVEDTFTAEDTVLETPHKTPKHKDLIKTDNEGSDETEIITIEDMFDEKTVAKIRQNVAKHDGLTKSNRTDSEGTDQSKGSESSEINPSVTHNNSDIDATVIQTNEITETPVPDPNRGLKVPRHIRFEDTAYMNEIEEDNSYVMSSRIRQYAKSHPHLRPCEPREDSPITDDDEVWVLKVPHDFDITHLKDTDILLDKDSEAKMKVDGQTYKGRVDDSIDRIALLTSEHSKFVLKSVPIVGTVQFHPRIPKVHYNYIRNNQAEFIPLPEIKRRHPLFGRDYETAMEIPESVKARLKSAKRVRQSPCTEEKKMKHSEIVQLNEKPQLRPSGNHTKKQNTNGDKNEPISKKKRITEKCDDIWDSEQEIEKVLFNS